MKSRRRLGNSIAVIVVAAAAGLAGCATQIPEATEKEAQSLHFGDEIPWRQRPSVEESLAIIPAEVLARRVLRSVTMRCKMTIDGGFSDCSIDDGGHLETGLAQAALRAAALTRVEPHLRSGRPVAGLFAYLTMTFDVGGPPGREDVRIWPGISGSRLFETRPPETRLLR